jgi:arginine deiminase
MNLELNNIEVTQLKELIYDYIDRIGGIDQLSDEMKRVLQKLSEKSLANKGILGYTIISLNSIKQVATFLQ